MLQVIKKALADPADKTKLTLLFGNISADDILLKPELDALAKQHANRFVVHYTLDKPGKVHHFDPNINVVIVMVLIFLMIAILGMSLIGERMGY